MCLRTSRRCARGGSSARAAGGARGGPLRRPFFALAMCSSAPSPSTRRARHPARRDHAAICRHRRDHSARWERVMARHRRHRLDSPRSAQALGAGPVARSALGGLRGAAPARGRAPPGSPLAAVEARDAALEHGDVVGALAALEAAEGDLALSVRTGAATPRRRASPRRRTACWRRGRGWSRRSGE